MTLKDLIKSIQGYESLSDAAIADVINAKNIDGTRVLGSRELLEWSGGGGRYMKLKKASENENLPDDVRSVAFVAFKLLDRPDVELDLSKTSHATMLAVLVLSGIFNDEDKNSLLSMAFAKQSLGEKNGLGYITFNEVAKARKEI